MGVATPKLVSMKRVEKKESYSEPVPVIERGSRGYYPYGLKINLSEEELSKLKIDVKNVKAGTKVQLSAVGEVTDVSDRYSVESGDSQSMGIQITALSLVPVAKSEKESSVAIPKKV